MYQKIFFLLFYPLFFAYSIRARNPLQEKRERGLSNQLYEVAKSKNPIYCCAGRVGIAWNACLVGYLIRHMRSHGVSLLSVSMMSVFSATLIKNSSYLYYHTPPNREKTEALPPGLD